MAFKLVANGTTNMSRFSQMILKTLKTHVIACTNPTMLMSWAQAEPLVDRATPATVTKTSWTRALPYARDLPASCFLLATAYFVTADHTPWTGLDEVIPGCGISSLIVFVLKAFSDFQAKEHCVPGAWLELAASETWHTPPTLCTNECCQVKALSAAMQGASHYVMQRGMWGTLWPSLHSGL